MYEGIVRRIQREISGNLLSEYLPRSELAPWGELDAGRVWRGPILNDERVFLRPEEQPTPGMSVLLLLDASASRMHQQEVISAQAYILAEALRQCRVPVQVESFCSIRGVTVFRRLVPFGADNARNVFRYFAAGWNRDGLALRMAGFTMAPVRTERKIVILLTDANPNDSMPLSRLGRLPCPMRRRTAWRMPPPRWQDFAAPAAGWGQCSSAAAETIPMRKKSTAASWCASGRWRNFPRPPWS